MIQTFDPQKHFGANQSRLQNYINLCLTNKFRSLYSKRRKDALSQPGNMSLDAQTEWNDPRAVDDEFCHSHSVHLQRAANASVLRKLEPTFQIQNARPQLRERVIAEQRVREPAARTVENLRLDQPTINFVESRGVVQRSGINRWSSCRANTESRMSGWAGCVGN